MISGINAIPDGVMQNEKGELYHEVPRTRIVEGVPYYEMVPRPVVLALSTDKKAVMQAQEEAARIGADFFNPLFVNGQQIGWMAHARKRQEEWPENLGSGAERYRMVPVPTSEEDALLIESAPAVAESAFDDESTQGVSRPLAGRRTARHHDDQAVAEVDDEEPVAAGGKAKSNG